MRVRKKSVKSLLSKSEVEIRNCCLRLLARREHSRRELLSKLESNGYKQDDAEKVIDEFAEKGWQSDERFAENFARQRIRSGHGPVRIANELRQRGIRHFDLDELVAEMAGCWLNLIEQVYLKKFKISQSLPLSEWSKQARFLQQRGFSIEMIQSLYKRLNTS